MLNKIFQLVMLVILNVGSTEIKTAKLESTNSRFESNFKVAILLPDKIDKSGWNKSGYEGLKLIEAELDAEIAYKDNLADYLESEEIKNILRQYALSGFDYIIGHGDSFQSAIEIVAKEFPQTKFALTSSSSYGNNQNLGVLNYKRYEARYLAGVVAALKTKTNKIGFIGGTNYSIIQAQATLL